MKFSRRLALLSPSIPLLFAACGPAPVTEEIAGPTYVTEVLCEGGSGSVDGGAGDDAADATLQPDAADADMGDAADATLAPDTADADPGDAADGAVDDAADSAIADANGPDTAPPPDAAYPLGVQLASLISSGQSLDEGYNANGSTTAFISYYQPFQNVMLVDPRNVDGGVDSGAWTFVPAIAPMRFTKGGDLNTPPNQWPNNIQGDTADAPLANTLAWLVDGGARYAVDNVGVDSQCIGALSKGGTTNAYASMMTIIARHKAIADAQGLSYVVAAFPYIGGECDYLDPDFAAKLLDYARKAAADAMAITGQGWYPPTVVTQPAATGGVWAGPNYAANAMLAAAKADPRAILFAGPRWQVEHRDGLHITARAQVRVANIEAHALDRAMHGLPTTALIPTGWSISGTTIRVHYPTGRTLAWDEDIPQWHAVSGSPWPACRGFETWDTNGSDGGITNHEHCVSAVLDGSDVVLTTTHALSAGGWRVGMGQFDDHDSSQTRPGLGGQLYATDAPFQGRLGPPEYDYGAIFVGGAGLTP